MSYSLKRLLDLNSNLKPTAASLVVPIVPTISMMEAAADTRNVFEPGDRLGDWLLPYHEVADETDLVDPELAERFGTQRAFELHVMAEAWAGCISGLCEWTKKRGIEGSNKFVDSWLHPELDGCPEEGWPKDKSSITDGCREHLSKRLSLPPFTHPQMLIPQCDLAFVVPGPERCTSIMAMRAGQRQFLMDYYLMGLDDVIAMDRLPFIPGYTIEHRFDDEERHRILASAAWKSAAQVVRTMTSENEDLMPLPPNGASVFLTRMANQVRSAAREVPDFYKNAPYDTLELSTCDSSLRMSVVDCRIDVHFSDSSGRSVHYHGWDYRLPSFADFVLNIIREMDSGAGGMIDLKISHIKVRDTTKD
jgi:hypothetical protein